MLKLDWNISDNHRANVRYAKTTQSDPVFPFISATGLTFDSTFYSQGKTIETTVAQLFSDWTPTFSTELKASRRAYDSVPTNNARLPLVGLSFTGPLPAGSPAGVPTTGRFLNFGTENSRQRNILGTDTQDLYAGANWSLGDHEVKFGTDYNRNKIYNAFLQNVFGNYTFSCVNSSATYLYEGGRTVNCSTGGQAVIEQAVLENFRIGRPSSYTLQVPATGGSLDNAVANFTLKNTGLFVQDTWNVSPALTLTYGVRVDSAKVDGKPFANPAASAPMVAGSVSGPTFTRQSGGFGYNNTNTIDGQKLVQPRFGFNYKLPTERLMQVRGGAGLFQGAAATVWMSNPFSNPGTATRIINCSSTSTPACPVTGGTFSFDPDHQNIPAGTTPAQNVDFLDPNMRQPSIMKSNLAFDTELPWYGVVFGAEALFTKNKDSIYYESLNLGAPTKTGTDGRNLYYNLNGYNSSFYTANNGTVTVTSGTSTKALSNLTYGNVYLAKKTDLGEAKVFTVSFSRPMIKGMGWSVAYTRTDATEVSPLTSSTSGSNFGGRSVFNPNENVAANSGYLVKDRVNMLFNYQKKFFGSYNTRFGMFYEGRSGKPFSWTVNNDLNGDGVAGNDLMYIPKAPGSGEVAFYGATDAERAATEARFWDIVNSQSDLRDAAGGVVGRNKSFSKWTNTVDMRISQEIPGIFKRNKATFTLDFLNFGNLLNKKWGHIEEVPFASAGGNVRGFVDYAGLDAQGRYVYAVRNKADDVTIKQQKNESQWAIQATLKYDF
jgi:hypothetical protein